MPDLIVGHVWRPQFTTSGPWGNARVPIDDRPCEFAGCGRPRAEHERGVDRKSPTAASGATGWGRWRQCPVCGAATGEPCLSLSGGRPVESDRVHSRRKLRAAAARGER